jgi:hypothetical protein
MRPPSRRPSGQGYRVIPSSEFCKVAVNEVRPATLPQKSTQRCGSLIELPG